MPLITQICVSVIAVCFTLAVMACAIALLVFIVTSLNWGSVPCLLRGGV